jgi:hypothetical protein
MSLPGKRGDIASIARADIGQSDDLEKEPTDVELL